jgi:hypothetical protein
MKQIETGREILDNPVSQNACEPMYFNDDGDSNEIDESDLLDSKHIDPIIST